MIVIGITGSIGMGKSTAGTMLEKLGVPVHDSDAAVHALLTFGSEAWFAIAAAFPLYKYPQIYKGKHRFNPFKKTQWSLNRKALGKIVFENDDKREELEGILHPFVQKSQNQFIKRMRKMGRNIVALDIPLLFETGAEKRLDYTINVTAPAHIQQMRVLSRDGMTEAKFEAILKRQMPDGEKSARADFVIHSGLGRAHMMKELKEMLAQISPANEDWDEEETDEQQ